MPEFQFPSIAAFFQMDGNAQFVWSVYILFALFLVINTVLPILERRRVIKQLRTKMQRQSGQKK